MNATLLVISMLLACVGQAGAGDGGDDARRAELIGALTATRLTVRVERAPAREVLGAVAVASGVPLLGRYTDERVTIGIDPEAPVTLELENEPALLALELALEQCSAVFPCTWQIRGGYLEVGPKERLAGPGAIERRAYPALDLLLEPEYFSSTGIYPDDREAFLNHPYRTAVLDDPGTGESRSQLALQIVKGIVSLVEPGNWDHGQLGDPVPGAAPAAIGRIALAGESIVVAAPDFVHREIDGYPEPVAPTPDEEQLGRRRERLDAFRHGSIEIVGITRPDEARRRWYALEPTVAPALEPPPDSDERRAQLLGYLLYTRVDASYEGVPLRACLDELRARTGVPIVGRYLDDAFRHGLDPDAPVSFEAPDVPLLTVLEMILAIGASEPSTWQIRKGMVEVGTKARLSVPAARETRLYYVRDLIIYIPEDARDPYDRHYQELMAVDRVGDIVETVEPGAWDYGQIDYDELNEADRLRPAVVPRGGEAPGPDRPSSPRRSIEDRLPPYFAAPKVASIRYWRDVMLVRAPDYIHREINGYPEPIPPPDLADAPLPLGAVRAAGDAAPRRWLPPGAP